MELYITALLALLVLLLLGSVFYLYKQNSLLLVKINKLSYDMNILQKGPNEDVQNVFGNMDMMNSFMNNLNQGEVNEEDGEDEEDNEESDDEEEESDDGEDNEESDNEEDDEEDNEESDNEEDDEVSDNEESDNEESDDEVSDLEVGIDDDEEKQSLNNEKKEIVINKVSSKNVPDEPAKSFDTGYTTVSTNDGCEYEVTSTKNGVKRWKKLNK